MKNHFIGKLLNVVFAIIFLLFVSSLLAQALDCSPLAAFIALSVMTMIIASISDLSVSLVTLLPTTALQKVNLLSEEAWSENQRVIENEPETESLATAIRKQNALGRSFVTKLTDAKKDHADVRVLWIDFCGDEAADCDADNYCDGIDSTEAGVDFKDYNITQCITDDFAANEDTFAGSFMDFQDYVLQNQNRKIANLLTRLNMKYLIFLHANAGFNRDADPFVFNLQNQTEIPAANYNSADLITDLIIDARMSKIRRPFALDGKNLMKAWLNAEFDGSDSANGGQGNLARKRYFDFTFDPEGFIRAGFVDSTFLVTPYAYAFVNKNFYQSNVPVYDADVKMWKYFIRVPAFGVTIDVLHQRTCVNLKKDRFKHVWKYTLHYDFLSNPFGCADVNGKRVSGILEYKKVA